jgi:hypothetical protein
MPSEVIGMIGSHEPFAAVQDALKLFGFDEVIVSMLPARLSRWLRLDLPRGGCRPALAPPRSRVGTALHESSAREPYQWTPRIRCASATCSVEACSSTPWSPRAAAESGKTL